LEELDGPAVEKLSNVGQCVKVTKYLLSRAPPCFRRHVKPLVSTVFVVVSNHQSVLGPRGYGPISLCVIHKEGLLLSSEDINRLMMAGS
jgi:hypothetical protein